MSQPSETYVVILCGGSGTRLWPLSRHAFPKFLRSFDAPVSLLAAAIGRGLRITSREKVLLVTSEAQAPAVWEVAHAFNLENVVIEPSARGTTAAFLLAVETIRQMSVDCMIVSMPADHLIKDDEAWERAVRAALGAASSSGIVALGVKPLRAAIEFGYIETAAPTTAGFAVARRFHEKPDSETAKAYVDQGNFLWNTAIMALRFDTASTLLGRFAVDIVKAVANARQEGGADSWASVPNVALEHALMEPASGEGLVSAIAVDFDWRDVGSWDDAVNLMSQSDVVAIASGAPSVVDLVDDGPRSRRYVFVGIEDVIVVDAGDVVLIARRGSSDHLRGVPAALGAANWSDLL